MEWDGEVLLLPVHVVGKMPNEAYTISPQGSHLNVMCILKCPSLSLFS